MGRNFEIGSKDIKTLNVHWSPETSIELEKYLGKGRSVELQAHNGAVVRRKTINNV